MRPSKGLSTSLPRSSTKRGAVRRIDTRAGGARRIPPVRVIRKATVTIVAALAFWRPLTAQDPAQNPTAAVCTVAGVVSAQRTPLPGAVLSLVAGDGQAADVSSSGIDGSFTLKAPAGQYKLTSQLTAFAPAERDVAIDAASCSQRVDVAMTLASRAAARAPAAAAPVARAQGRRGATGAAPQFQNLELVADQAGLARSDENA